MAVGLKRGTNKLLQYNPQWQKIFLEEKELLSHVFQNTALDIQHIGSTAIVGIPAKPIIDIAVGVHHLEIAETFVQPLRMHGYTYFGEHNIPGQRLFVKGSEQARTHYVHVAEYKEWKWSEYILFRNYLQKHPDVAQDYAGLKQSLAQRYPTDRKAYIVGKVAFVQKVLERANIE